ncbi:hypothetical protein MPTK1_4g17680 [Marchantia polymorpha subsp. ruderalis]|uniref:Uncharacterized protein n=2 Tax=Marchantia polymorpha TaxID=3197 RepID=A0AAF6BAX6_MARPO|nr:hypothetical protein MARPO_0041s0050 [Marchantia polymorpha]BBN09160.1 hypothetical protein Mp_4g17680 [Marchantia polymorpha subsp. ruderalis]PTQ40149.1 hypothetical protein MARPO_0041s0050 [Marchantia polymorpha]PTQ40150.1 hypothetical protein MARPO_0041s0050 [Marchantia polymorpha]BBN09161.1 hypothetical protein Mp_4g17680 [Marchantia polymorpha subsp. ruderalis]|eukprot:PTQ40148.1 hypothetical protein MARPO_0041s0050 [Marchantia polymorpha]
MSTSRDDRYKHSDRSNSTTLGQDGPTDPNGVSTRVEEIESSNSYGGKTIKTTYYRLSGTQQVQSGGLIVYKDKNGKVMKRTNF